MGHPLAGAGGITMLARHACHPISFTISAQIARSALRWSKNPKMMPSANPAEFFQHHLSGPIYTAKKSCRLRNFLVSGVIFWFWLVTCHQKVGKVKKKNELRGRFFPPQFVLLISTLLSGRIAFDSVRHAAVAASHACGGCYGPTIPTLEEPKGNRLLFQG